MAERSVTESMPLASDGNLILSGAVGVDAYRARTISTGASTTSYVVRNKHPPSPVFNCVPRSIRTASVKLSNTPVMSNCATEYAGKGRRY